MIVMVQGGSTVLVNPQEPVLKMLDHARTADMFTIRRRKAGLDRTGHQHGRRPGGRDPRQ